MANPETRSPDHLAHRIELAIGRAMALPFDAFTDRLVRPLEAMAESLRAGRAMEATDVRGFLIAFGDLKARVSSYNATFETLEEIVQELPLGGLRVATELG